jgi:ParB family chromosome partitioning protein
MRKAKIPAGAAQRLTAQRAAAAGAVRVGGVVQAVVAGAETRRVIQFVPVEELADNPENPQARVESLGELPDSLSRRGMHQPVRARRVEEWAASHREYAAAVAGRSWVIVDGHRRVAAARVAGLATVPVWLLEGDTDDTLIRLETATTALPLTQFEIAEGYRQLRERGLTLRQIAEATGTSHTTVSARLRLLDLPAELRTAVEHGELRTTALDWQALDQLDPAAMAALAQSVANHDPARLSQDFPGLLAAATPTRAKPAGKATPKPKRPSQSTRATASPPDAPKPAAVEPPAQEMPSPGKETEPRWDALLRAARAKLQPGEILRVVALTEVLGRSIHNGWKLGHSLAVEAGIKDAGRTPAEWREALSTPKHGGQDARARAMWILALAEMERAYTAEPSGPLAQVYLRELAQRAGYQADQGGPQ